MLVGVALAAHAPSTEIIGIEPEDGRAAGGYRAQGVADRLYFRVFSIFRGANDVHVLMARDSWSNCEEDGIAGGKASMGKSLRAPKNLVKIGIPWKGAHLYELFMQTVMGRNGSLTQIDAISAHETDHPVDRTRLLRNLVMLDVIFIGITVIFFAACLGYTLACERL
jgi:hypothetical protein